MTATGDVILLQAAALVQRDTLRAAETVSHAIIEAGRETLAEDAEVVPQIDPETVIVVV